MKILKISGQGIASLYDRFSVDLEEGPIADSGIFAVTGRTGSGKSTILDVMCLALYHQAARYQGIRDKKTLDQNDMYNNIMSRGAGVCSAEVEYIGINGVRYRSVWGLRRIKTRNGEPKFENADCRLESWSDSAGWIRQGGSGLKALLRDKAESIGLDYSQFTRVVLLPQGQFTSFLTAEPKDRTSILNGIADTEIYKLISSQIYLDYKAIKERKEQLEEQQKSLKLLSEAERLEYQNTSKEFDKKISDLRETVLKLKSYDKDVKNCQSEANALKLLSQDLETQESVLADDLKKLAIFEEHGEAREHYQKLIEESKKLKICTQKRDEVEQELGKLQANKTLVSKEHLEAEQKLKDAEEIRKSTAPEINKARALDATNAQKEQVFLEARQALQTLNGRFREAKDKQMQAQNDYSQALSEQKQVEARQKLVAPLKDLSSSLSFIEEAPHQFEVLVGELKASQESFENLEALIQKTQELIKNTESEQNSLQAQKADLIPIAQNREALMQDITSNNDRQAMEDKKRLIVRECGKDLNNLKQINDELRYRLNHLVELRAKYTECQNNKKLAEQSVANLSREYELSNQLYEMQLRVVSMDEERLKLTPGKECPLCGSIHHPFVDGSQKPALQSEVDKTKAELQACRIRLDDARRLEATIDADLKSLQGHGQNCRHDVEQATSRFVNSLVAFGDYVQRLALTEQDVSWENAAPIFKKALLLKENALKTPNLNGEGDAQGVETRASTSISSDANSQQDFDNLLLIEPEFALTFEFLHGLEEKLNTELKGLSSKQKSLRGELEKAQKAQSILEEIDKKLEMRRDNLTKLVNREVQAKTQATSEQEKAQATADASASLLTKIKDAILDKVPEITELYDEVMETIVKERESKTEFKAIACQNLFNNAKTMAFWDKVLETKNGIKEAITLSERLDILERTCALKKQELAALEGSLTEAELSFNEAQKRLDKAQAELQESLEARAKLLDGRSADEVVNSLDASCTQALAHEKAMRGELEKIGLSMQQLTGEQGVLDVTFKEATENKVALEARWQADVEIIGLPQNVLVDVFSMPVELRAVLSKKRQELIESRNDVKIKQGLLGEHKATCLEKAQQIDAEYFKDADVALGDDSASVLLQLPLLREDALTEVEGVLEELQGKYKAIESALAVDADHAKTCEVLTLEITALKPDLELRHRLNDLIGSADGSKFCNIAQSITLFALTTYANNYLHTLRPRYSLCVAEDGKDGLTLSVVDHDCADCERSVLSLSGGEKFLVSLSLALGLSDMTCSGTVVQSLFIDEGFDCVDTESLSIVLEALGKLQRGSRTLGIISHVEMLARNVPTRVKVTAISDGRSRIEVD